MRNLLKRPWFILMMIILLIVPVIIMHYTGYNEALLAYAVYGIMLLAFIN